MQPREDLDIRASRACHPMSIPRGKKVGPSCKPQWGWRWGGRDQEDTDNTCVWKGTCLNYCKNWTYGLIIISFLVHQLLGKGRPTYVCLQFPSSSQKNTNEISQQESQSYFCPNWQSVHLIWSYKSTYLSRTIREKKQLSRPSSASKTRPWIIARAVSGPQRHTNRLQK